MSAITIFWHEHQSMISFERLVDRIYEAPVAPDMWTEVLHELGGVVTGKGAILIVRRHDNWLGGFSSPGVSKNINVFFNSEIAKRSTASMRLVAANKPGFVADYELFSEEELVSDPFYTHWAALNDTHHGAATAILIPNGDVALVQVQRAKGQPTLDRSDLDILDRFRPHLARSALLTARWRLERLRVAAEALAIIGLPAAVISPGGRVLATNSLIEQLKDFIVWRPNDQIALSDSAATDLLAASIASISNPASTAVRSFPVRGQNTGNIAIAHLIPITGAARDFFDGAFGVFVIMPVNAPSAPDDSLLRGLFDLTPAEARIASAITKGFTLEQIAAHHSVAYDTVKAQVRAVFSKTGTNKQSQIASLLAGLPRLPLS